MPVWWRNSKPISRTVLAGLVGLACASQAQALSCLPMGPGDVYRIVAKSEDPFVIVEGRVTFDEALLPKYSQSAPEATKTPTRIPAQVTGLLLGEQYFDQPVDGEMTLEAHCLGPWCGSLKSGGRYLFFARNTEGKATAYLEPCGGFFFDAEDGSAGDIVLQCHQGRACPSKLPDDMEGAVDLPRSD
ncbi:hypothetical protein [Tritonibacter horizontis]|uniref:Uncharacterized protein n=1 Tax=Tritonibacter horizontis TaxID=1768241 RepID=A0A132BZP7_9RHOB|nr:hypothetical protein [Tritonibacter horizontis]KUP93736.1 hypothetical protein TRIHO_13860 [Tritonibacter horizontis]